MARSSLSGPGCRDRGNHPLCADPGGRGRRPDPGARQCGFYRLLAILRKIAVVIVVTALAQWLMNHINNQITYRVVKDIRTRAFNHLEILPLSYIDSHQYGDIISRIIADIDQFSEGLLWALPSSLPVS